MQNSKFFLASMTMIGALIVLLVQVGPLIGITFTEVDGQIINENIDKIVTSVAAIVAVVGRVKANSSLTLMPKPSASTLKAHWFFNILAIPLSLMLLVACMPGTGSADLGTPQQNLFATKARFAVVQEEAANYASLPFCSDTVPIACSEPEFVVKLDEVSDQVEVALDAAEVVVRDPNAGVWDKQNTVAAAQTALRALISTMIAAQGGVPNA